MDARARRSAQSTGRVRSPDEEKEYDLEDQNIKPASHMEMQQFLLHLLSTEIWSILSCMENSHALDPSSSLGTQPWPTPLSMPCCHSLGSPRSG
jgi:hypothetical protein